jgi:hypothetical protein
MELQEVDARVRDRYGDRVAPGRSGRVTRALVAPSGRPITRLPLGWVPVGHEAGRLAVPPGGGELLLPCGRRAMAEPIDSALQVYVVRTLDQQELRSSAPVRPLLKLALLDRDRPLLQLDGGETELRPRLAEILALLCAYPHGYTAEGLCADLHGDRGSPGSVRVEVSRLRKLLGPWIDTERYRLTCDVETDVRHVEGLLTAGRVRDAAERYPGPLLPSSEAPGIVRERERLEGWLRQAVMTSDDTEALWAWVQTPTAGDDLAAWKRLLAHLPYNDPRRPRVAARVRELRRAAATSM